MKARAARKHPVDIDPACRLVQQRLDSLGLWFTEPIVHEMFVLSGRSLNEPLRNLPVSVAFRASGGLRVWNSVFEALPASRSVRDMASDPDELVVDVQETLEALMQAICRCVATDDETRRDANYCVQGRMAHASLALSFWLRAGTLYEPTPALGGLLGGVDLSLDLPIGLLRPPAHAMCILVPIEQRRRCAGVESIFVFTSRPKRAEPGRVERAITLYAVRRRDSEVIQVRDLRLDIGDETCAVRHLLASVMKRRERESDDEYASIQVLWPAVLDYTVKTLLYLSLDDATISQDRTHSNAPKTFPGLGRRKRELRQAQIEQLYDRYIVGPARVDDWAGAQAGELSLDGQISPHWRRGHFRQQVHGQQGKQRKLIFIKPTLIRADLLGTVQ